MEKVNKICIYIVLMIISFIIGFSGSKYFKNKEDKIPISIQDTIYNKVILDSIKYHINKKDSVIYKLNTEMKYEINKSYELNDSATIELFYKLVNGR